MLSSVTPQLGKPTKLPHGWETAEDPDSGQTYYFDRKTGETTWDFPVRHRNSIVCDC
jgi:hypothetical protein